MAIAAVLAYHAAPPLVAGGLLGVEVFFVLSGYLLTSLLLEEHERTGRLDWLRYAERRVRRVAPALLVFLIAVVVLGGALARSDAYRLRGDVLWSALGLTNWHLISDGSSYFEQLGRPPLVRHLWSMAVEIQFYVFIPLLVAGLVQASRRVGMASLGLGIALSSIAMGLLYESPDPSRAYYGTDARIGALLTGALLALIMARRRPADEASPWAAGLGAAGLGVLAILFLAAGERSRFLYPWGFLACRLATVLVIIAAAQPGWLANALGSKVPRWLGLRSYSIYLWHWPLLVLMRPGIDVAWPPAVAIGVALSCALALGELSFRLVEVPFIRGRAARSYAGGAGRSLLPAARWANAALAVAATVALLAHLPTVDPIAQNLRAGEQFLAVQPASAPSPAAPAAGVIDSPPSRVGAPTAAVPSFRPLVSGASRPIAAIRPQPTLPPGPPPGSVNVTALGDSVMLSAARPLQERLGSSGHIDAKLSRQFAQGVQVARQLREEGRLGEVVIVHLGTNGPPKNSDVDALMHELAGVGDVLLVTVRMPKRWEGATNQTLNDAAARHPTVRIVDWYGFSEGHRDWFESDGTHLKVSGGRAYADLLASSTPVPDQAPTTTTSEPPPPSTTTTTTSPPATLPATTTSTTTTTTTTAPPP